MTNNFDTSPTVLYKGQNYEVRTTETFDNWFGNLKDRQAVGRMASQFRKLGNGNLGNAKSVGDGVHELRMNFGPGYRAYFINRNNSLILLLCGGDKSSQKRDIVLAKDMAKGIFDDQGDKDENI